MNTNHPAARGPPGDASRRHPGGRGAGTEETVTNTRTRSRPTRSPSARAPPGRAGGPRTWLEHRSTSGLPARSPFSACLLATWLSIILLLAAAGTKLTPARPSQARRLAWEGEGERGSGAHGRDPAVGSVSLRHGPAGAPAYDPILRNRNHSVPGGTPGFSDQLHSYTASPHFPGLFLGPGVPPG